MIPFIKTQPILILSHMRSGSSLLEHILASHDEIMGFGEQNRIYRKALDFIKMEYYIRKKSNQYLKSVKYTTDQVLHNELTPNIPVLNKVGFKLIFLVRSPEETLSSIEHLGSKDYSIHNTGNSNSVNYYCNRLSYLLQLKRMTPVADHYVINYSDLIERPEETLMMLSNFLNLKSPLSKEYKLKKSTGNFGDRSDNIKKGEIFKTKRKPIFINEENTIKLDNVFREFTSYFNTI